MHITVAALVSLLVFAPPVAGSGFSQSAPAQSTVFEAKGCFSCHAVNERGGTTARDLSWIGLLRTPESLRRSLVDPSKHPNASALSKEEIEQVVAYLRTLRKMWALEPETGERTRDIAPPSENAAFFNRPERDSEERPEQLIDALEIPRGAAVADLGSGTGYFTWRLAEKVGPSGKVIAVDVQQEMLDRTAAAVAQHKMTNVEYVLATESDPRLPERALDLVFIAYAYHEFSEPEAIMAKVKRSLKPGGRVVILEYAKESNIAPASPLHKMSFQEIRREIEPMGFAIDRLLDFLPVQHGVIFTIK